MMARLITDEHREIAVILVSVSHSCFSESFLFQIFVISYDLCLDVSTAVVRGNSQTKTASRSSEFSSSVTSNFA